MNEDRTYLCIDLKTFFASCECVERKLDPLNTNLVVADSERTEKTICLAITSSLKAYGLGGRARLFEVLEKVKEINYDRLKKTDNKKFEGKSYLKSELDENKKLELDFIIAKPQMAKYIEYSTKVYNTYLKFVSRDDIFVYSIDEVFIDVTKYLSYYNLKAKELASKMVSEVFKTVGITATCGIGTNMYLAKIAMDIVAKHIQPNSDGVRIAELDEMTYRKLLWNHKPLTDFWRVGPGISSKLYKHGIYTMGDIAKASLECEDLLYKLFGINAELLIDHAWGYEPCNIEDVKNYKPKETSLSQGQVLHEPYTYSKTKTIIREMAEAVSLELLNKKLLTDQIVISIGYDISNLQNPLIRKDYHGDITIDYYGRTIPKGEHGSINLNRFTNSTDLICKASLNLFEKIINKKLLVRRINISLNHTIKEDDYKEDKNKYEQLDLFTDYKKEDEKKEKEKIKLQKEKKMQETVIDLKNKFGKNAILKGYNLKEEGTTKERNSQIGGHRA